MVIKPLKYCSSNLTAKTDQTAYLLVTIRGENLLQTKETNTTELQGP